MKRKQTSCSIGYIFTSVPFLKIISRKSCDEKKMLPTIHSLPLLRLHLALHSLIPCIPQMNIGHFQQSLSNPFIFMAGIFNFFFYENMLMPFLSLCIQNHKFLSSKRQIDVCSKMKAISWSLILLAATFTQSQGMQKATFPQGRFLFSWSF